MKGFGNLDSFDELKKISDNTEAEPLIESEYLPVDQEKLDNVIVPILENSSCSYKMEEQEESDKHEEPEHPEHHEVDKSTGASGNEAEIVEKDKQDGSAGNPENKEEEAIMGGMGMGSIGGGIKKEMARMESSAKMEGFTPNEIVDETPMDNATDQFNQNSVDKVKDTFNKIFDNKFGKAKDKNIDFDYTVAKSTISNTPLKNIPKGW